MSGSLLLEGEVSVANRTSRHDGIAPNSNSNSDDTYFVKIETRFVKVGVDLYGNSIFHRVEHWRLFGFCVRYNALWDDWCMHFVSSVHLELVDTVGSVSNRSYYNLSD